MKEKLYTIPLSEALEEGSECLFCTLFERLENDALHYTLGPSYMEPDNRIITNEKGFCRRHYQKMYGAGNRLGLSLMVSSHFDEILKKYDEIYKGEFNEKKGIFKIAAKKDKVQENKNYIEVLEESCFICDKVKADMDKFFDTFIYLWKTEKQFRENVKKSKGFCLFHYEKLMSTAAGKMSASDFSDMKNELYENQKKNLLRVKEELEWFIKKFDYRFKYEPWNNSRDSLRRALMKLSSFDPDHQV